MRTMSLSLVIVAAVGCKKSEEATCAQVVDNMLVVTKEQVMRSGGTPSKKNLIAECESRKLTPKQKTCMVKAVDLEQLAGCTGLKPQVRRDTSGHEPIGGGGAQGNPGGPQMTDNPHALPLGHPSVVNRGSGSARDSGSNGSNAQ
jgi:hypothetical protein